MEKALQQIVGYLFLHLNTTAQQSAAVEKFASVVSISVKADISTIEINCVPCTTTISVGGRSLNKDAFKGLQTEILLLLTNIPVRPITHLDEYNCPHCFIEDIIFQIHFQVIEEKGRLEQNCLRVLEFIKRVSCVNPQVTVHYCVIIGTAKSCQTFGTTKRIFSEKNINLLAYTSKYPGSYKSRSLLDCLKLHPTTISIYKLLIPTHLRERHFTGDLTLRIAAALNPCLKMFPNKSSSICSVLIYLYISSLPIYVGGSEVSFFNDPKHVANWENHHLHLVRTNKTVDKDLIWPDVWYDAVSHTVHSRSVQEKQSLLLFFFLDYADIFCSELPEIHGMHQAIMREVDQILFLNQSTVRESVQSVIDEALQDFSKAESNHRALQHAGFVTAEAISNIISNSTNHVFRKSCSGYLQDCNKHSAMKTIQHMFLKAAHNRTLKTKECDSGKEVAEDAQTVQCGISSINPNSTISHETDGCTPGSSYHQLKNRRRVKKASGEESQRVDKRSDTVATEQETRPVTSCWTTSEDPPPETSKEDDDWLQEVYNLSNW